MRGSRWRLWKSGRSWLFPGNGWRGA
ncbi:KxYKxGKxW signal peptide domain-containing protein [Microvirga terrestris]